MNTKERKEIGSRPAKPGKALISGKEFFTIEFESRRAGRNYAKKKGLRLLKWL